MIAFPISCIASFYSSSFDFFGAAYGFWLKSVGISVKSIYISFSDFPHKLFSVAGCFFQCNFFKLGFGLGGVLGS